jgi:DNA-binding beta-propeller fold protein YncE
LATVAIHGTSFQVLMKRLAIASLLVAAAACGSSQNSPPEGSPDPMARGRNGQRMPALDSARRNRVIENARPDAPARAGMLVVANQQGASATILDAATLRTIATLPVGIGPHEVAISPDGRWAVVTNYGDREVQGNTLSVIDLALAAPAVVRTIDLGTYHRPHGAVFVGGGTTLLVTSETSQRLLIVDVAAGRVDTALATNGRGSHMVVSRRDGRRAWTANITDSSVTEYDVDARRTLRTWHAAPANEGIAATPGGLELWVGSNTEHTVTVLDAVRGTALETLTGFGSTYRLGISRASGIAVVSDPVRNRIWLYDVASRSRRAELDLSTVAGLPPAAAAAGAGGAPGESGAGPEGVAFDPIVDFAYVTLHGVNQVIAVDLGARKIVGHGAVGAGPDGIAFSPLLHR